MSRRKYDTNTYTICGDVVTCTIKDRGYFTISLSDYDMVSMYTWRMECSYPRTCIDKRHVRLHELLLGKRDGMVIDHIDKDSLNNMRCNLRFIKQSLNSFNAKISKNNTSGTPGVYYSNGRHKWVAQIAVDRKCIYLGIYADISDAIAKRRLAEIKYFGEYANKEVS